MKMKQRKWRGAVLAVLGCLMLTGCGEAPYELTDEEQQLIVSYSAHVVSKYNRYQKDGLTHVPNLEEELAMDTEDVPETEIVPETEQNGEFVPDSDGATTNTEIEQPADKTTFDTVFADMGLTFTYLGNEVTASYMENAAYAVKAGNGKNLLVLKLKVENLTEEAIAVDNMATGDVYSVKYVMESEKVYHAKSVMTLLLNDFVTYEGTIEPQEAVEAVIVFEIPAETTEVEKVELIIERNGKKFEINL